LSRMPGAIFAAQPAALAMEVSFTVSATMNLSVMKVDYNDARVLALVATSGGCASF
jgi:hypothetical protein